MIVIAYKLPYDNMIDKIETAPNYYNSGGCWVW